MFKYSKIGGYKNTTFWGKIQTDSITHCIRCEFAIMTQRLYF